MFVAVFELAVAVFELPNPAQVPNLARVIHRPALHFLLLT